MKELWQILMHLKDWVKGSPIRMLVVVILMRRFCLLYCYYVVYDEELLKDPFFERFQTIQYIFPDGNHLQKHDPAKLFGMKWIPECTVEDKLQRMFVARGFSQDTMIERVMFCTYPLDIVSNSIFCSNKLLLPIIGIHP